MVEATEFPSLVRRYSVRGVPRTVVNERVFIDGALPEEEYLHRVLEATVRPVSEETR
jgi:predicted DsbA family dithiol-disulfide isomerase